MFASSCSFQPFFVRPSILKESRMSFRVRYLTRFIHFSICRMRSGLLSLFLQYSRLLELECCSSSLFERPAYHKICAESSVIQFLLFFAHLCIT
ncbi:unnamed protein product [Moneuplotes crassus]|uniref:Uncharacterized protein n=1 Tax=Euplotes crassus TaxID=5936 RepID=A0AAD1XCW3_EUPCR|nr:unnamed protein product [Moneuplotes crassus]